MNDQRLLKGALTRNEIKQLVQAREYPRDKALISFLFLTGGRIGEIVRTVKQEDRKVVTGDRDTYIEWAIKTEKNPNAPVRFPSYPAFEPFWPFVRYWIRVQDHLHEDYLFTLSRRYAYEIINQAGKAAKVLVESRRKEGLMTLYPHIFRHSRCTDLVANWGLSAEQLQAFMGWSSTKPYSTYAHLKSEDYRPWARGLKIRRRDL